jgi:hypothetical protein
VAQDVGPEFKLQYYKKQQQKKSFPPYFITYFSLSRPEYLTIYMSKWIYWTCRRSYKIGPSFNYLRRHYCHLLIHPSHLFLRLCLFMVSFTFTDNTIVENMLGLYFCFYYLGNVIYWNQKVSRNIWVSREAWKTCNATWKKRKLGSKCIEGLLNYQKCHWEIAVTIIKFVLTRSWYYHSIQEGLKEEHRYRLPH